MSLWEIASNNQNSKDPHLTSLKHALQTFPWLSMLLPQNLSKNQLSATVLLFPLFFLLPTLFIFISQFSTKNKDRPWYCIERLKVSPTIKDGFNHLSFIYLGVRCRVLLQSFFSLCTIYYLGKVTLSEYSQRSLSKTAHLLATRRQNSRARKQTSHSY